ncbi:MAG: 3-isopropylmalate dehydratase small subunit [Spirochaetes bacterium]|nr:3-isopropylmalate dehydratase small subunit [Spirochaetota bacterium]
MKDFGGKILFLDRSDINTDEIIPAKYLIEVTKKALKPYLLEDLKLNGFDPKKDLTDKQVIITRQNFGCGSSREHAPWALEINDINIVIAENFARIFRQNMFNCGMIALELPAETLDHLFDQYQQEDAYLNIDLKNEKFEIYANGKKESFPIQLKQFDKALIKAGGWVEYANQHY